MSVKCYEFYNPFTVKSTIILKEVSLKYILIITGSKFSYSSEENIYSEGKVMKN